MKKENRMKDKHGKEITIDSKIKDEAGEYIVKLGNFDKEDMSEWIAYGSNGINKLLWPERARLFELVEE